MRIRISRKTKNAEPPQTVHGAEPQKEPESVPAKQSAVAGDSRVFGVLRAPHVTEKASRLEGDRKYVFRVARHATKNQIAAAIHEAYGIVPEAVSVISVPRKKRRLRLSMGFKKGYKKAIVTLPEGRKIEVIPK